MAPSWPSASRTILYNNSALIRNGTAVKPSECVGTTVWQQGPRCLEHPLCWQGGKDTDGRWSCGCPWSHPGPACPCICSMCMGLQVALCGWAEPSVGGAAVGRAKLHEHVHPSQRHPAVRCKSDTWTSLGWARQHARITFRALDQLVWRLLTRSLGPAGWPAEGGSPPCTPIPCCSALSSWVHSLPS